MGVGTLQLATTGTFSGLTEQGYINTALAALANMIQGASAPTTTSTGLTSTAGVWWHDTGNNLIKVRDQADTTWIPVFQVNETGKIIAVYEGQASIASAATVGIGAAAANYLNITGTTTITAFDSIQAGTRRILEFASALTLTHNATSLILPGAANITTAAGDVAIMISEGSGNWRCASYMRASAPPPLRFTSAQQTITVGGGLTLAHGLGAQPSLVQIKLHCTTAENGYSIGDEVIVPNGIQADSNGTPRGASIVPDSTNLNVRYGTTAAATLFFGAHKTTGALIGFTNTSWNAIFQAWV